MSLLTQGGYMMRQAMRKVDLLAEVVKQGPAYTLLGIMIWGIYTILPSLIEKIESGYHRNLLEMQNISLQMEKATETVLKQLQEEHKATHEMLKELLKLKNLSDHNQASIEEEPLERT